MWHWSQPLCNSKKPADEEAKPQYLNGHEYVIARSWGEELVEMESDVSQQCPSGEAGGKWRTLRWVSCPTLTTMEIRGTPMLPPLSGTSFSKNCPIFSWAFGSMKGFELSLTIFHLDPKMVSSTRSSRLHVNKVPRRIPFGRKDYCLWADFLNSGELLTITLNAHGFCFL